MRSWEVRLATALAWLSVLPGVLCFVLAFLVMGADPGFLFAILPIVAFVLFAVGVLLVPAGVGLALQLQKAAPGARMRTALAGGGLVFTGPFVLAASPFAGIGLVLYGGTLLWLMTTAGAARDLGPWAAYLKQPASQTPWWQTWRAGLAQDIPLWELTVLYLAGLAFVVGLIAVPVVAVDRGRSAYLLLLLPVSIAVVYVLERRMRARLATRSGR